MDKGAQILKCRDDRSPILLNRLPEEKDIGTVFTIKDGVKCSWAKTDDVLTEEMLRKQLEPWLTALFQSEHLSLFVGSGLSHAVHAMATDTSLPGMSAAKFSAFGKEIEAASEDSSANFGREMGNFEDQIRVAIELQRGLEILSEHNTDKEAESAILEMEINDALAKFMASILQGESEIIKADEQKREVAFNYLVSFLMSFASRTGTRERLQIFTTNYDRIIEAGAESAGLHLLDRFVGSLAPIFRSSRLDIDMHYNPPGIRGEPRFLEGVARFTKLHGSLDWVSVDKNIRRFALPFGAQDAGLFLKHQGTKVVEAMQLMIYPNSAKDRETAAYPYVELFRDFAAAVCRPNSTIVCYGYSFGDEHINRVIEDMLTIPSTHLVVISFDDPLERIMHTYEKLGRPAQVTLMLGDHFGDFKSLVDNYLPKPAIDKTTYRMAEILRARWGSSQIGSASQVESKESLT